MLVSVVICTYNPQLDNFNIVLEALQKQTLPKTDWQLIIIDNKSDFLIKEAVDVSWHPKPLIYREEKIGLLNARIAGFHLAETPLIVFVDDDNKLKGDYLEKALKFHYKFPGVGSFGGKSLPLFETPPPKWFASAGISLGCQQHGEKDIISEYYHNKFQITEYPAYAPIGTGMVITKNALGGYIEDIQNDSERLKLGRSGGSLYSGEDNDMVLTTIKKGFEIAYSPGLVVYHIIPKERLLPAYLSKMAYNSYLSWIKLLAAHKICPWKAIPKWTVTPRKVKAWFNYRVLASPANYIKWRGACGMFDALAEINE